MMGRYPHFSFKPGENDLAICTLALRRMGIEHLRERNYLTLSGGERQMTHFARVLAQVWEKEGEECRFLLLDEPTSSLDLKHQHDFLSIAQGFSREGAVVVVAIHDVNLAAQYADAVFALHHGTILAGGSPEEVLIPAVLDGLYGVKTSVFRDPSLRYPVIVSRQA
jgi:iron complex transport system ATP-binding protein